jgi:hypothetical protein
MSGAGHYVDQTPPRRIPTVSLGDPRNRVNAGTTTNIDPSNDEFPRDLSVDHRFIHAGTVHLTAMNQPTKFLLG